MKHQFSKNPKIQKYIIPKNIEDRMIRCKVCQSTPLLGFNYSNNIVQLDFICPYGHQGTDDFFKVLEENRQREKSVSQLLLIDNKQNSKKKDLNSLLLKEMEKKSFREELSEGKKNIEYLLKKYKNLTNDDLVLALKNFKKLTEQQIHFCLDLLVIYEEKLKSNLLNYEIIQNVRNIIHCRQYDNFSEEFSTDKAIKFFINPHNSLLKESRLEIQINEDTLPLTKSLVQFRDKEGRLIKK